MLNHFTLSALWLMAFFSPFSLKYSMLLETEHGGEVMDDDTDIFEMFLELMVKLATDDPEGRMRVRSQNPRYAESDEINVEKAKHKR